FVLVDAAPILATSDAVAIAPLVDAVLLVADADRVNQRNVARARRQLELIDAPLLGSVLNRFDEARGVETPYHASAQSNGHVPHPQRLVHEIAETLGAQATRPARRTSSRPKE